MHHQKKNQITTVKLHGKIANAEDELKQMKSRKKDLEKMIEDTEIRA